MITPTFFAFGVATHHHGYIDIITFSVNYSKKFRNIGRQKFVMITLSTLSRVSQCLFTFYIFHLIVLSVHLRLLVE